MTTKWHQWSWDERPEKKSGIYVLVLQKPICKVYDKDDIGVLYIGKADYLSNRLRPKEIFKKNKNYDYWISLGKLSKYTFDHSCFTHSLDFDKKNSLIFYPVWEKTAKSLVMGAKPFLFFTYSEDHVKFEQDLLSGHLTRYGQLPPFNIKGSSLKKVNNQDGRKTGAQWKTYSAFEKTIKKHMIK